MTVDARELDWGDGPEKERPTLRAVPRLPITLPPVDALTEAGAARRFAAQHAGRIIYDHRRGRWLLWDRHRWRPDSNGAIVRTMIETARLWQHDALAIKDARERGRVVEWAIGLERRGKIDAVLALARCLEPLADSGEDFDRDGWLLCTPSGVIDLHTGERRNGRPEDRITMQTAAPFDPEARCPRWEQAFHEWFPDPDLADYVWRAAGYSLTGDTGEQVLFAGYNRGAGGKTTFLRTIAYVLGDYSHDLPFSALELSQRTGIPNELAALEARRFVTASETCDGVRLNEARVKSLTGGDLVSARYLHQEWFSFQPTCKLWLAFNHKPVVRDDSYGFWRRVRLIPFLRTFSPDPTLAAKLRAEAPGILAWLVRGCREWQERGLDAPAIVTSATDDYQRDSDVFGRFLEEACEESEGAEVGATDLFKHYETWAERQGYGPRERLSRTAFGRKASERLRRVEVSAGRVYQGVARRFPVEGF